jgi:UDP-N-acetylmuramate dehydrogenase
MNKYLSTLKKLDENAIKKNQDLSKFSWFNLGGPAELFFKPNTINELSSFLKINDKAIHILGAGSNTLIRDGGLKGVTLKLGSNFSYTKKLDDKFIESGSATLDRKLSNFAAENTISGLEFLSCIPGTIGGAIKMNSGCYGEDVSKILVSLKAMDRKGNIKVLNKEEINFSYRGCDLLDELIILSAVFEGTLSSKKKVEEKQISLIKKKKESQPSQIKTCGSTFKNPKNKKAWKLIKDSGCQNISVGNAKISEKHCNFFVNNGKATSSDIENLIERVKDKVFKETGVKLELEIKVIGINK